VDKCAGPFGLATDQAVAGDWTGNGKARVGVFRPSTGQWFLDNGNNVWEGCGIDLCACCFGMEGDRAAVGDWDGNGIDDIGVFRPSTLRWYVDMNGNRVWNAGVDQITGLFGHADDWPVVGDWTGVGNVDKIGVFEPSGAGGIWVNTTWVLERV
jgi:hypothetical protein